MYCVPQSSKGIARMLIRIGFGISLICVGIAHSRDIVTFAMSVGKGFDGVPALVSLGTIWGYLLPFLYILGGISYTFKLLPRLGTWLVGIALVSIPAGLMLQSAISGVSLAVTMPSAMNAWIWVLVFMYAAKSASCCCNTCAVGGMCAMPAEKPIMKSAAKAPMVAMPKKVVASPAVHKPTAKKPLPKK